MRGIIENGLPYPRDFIEVREWLKEGRLKADKVEYYSGHSGVTAVRDGSLFVIAASSISAPGDPLKGEFDPMKSDVYYE